MQPLDWKIRQALKSTRSLSDALGELTEEECLRALEIEVETSRRQVVIDRLIQRAADIRYHVVLANLKEKFNGT